MLPLWIIDITGNQSRRDEFLSLVEKMDHVYISRKYSSQAQDNSCGEKENTIKLTPSNLQQTDSEIYAKDRIEVEKSSHLEGDYWFYSDFSATFESKEKLSEAYLEYIKGEEPLTEESKTNLAEWCYQFQDNLVRAGQQFVDRLRRSNCPPYQTISVVVLGDATEELTRTIFSSVAIILQKEKERFLPAHVHQGMAIYGALYVPCNINTFDAGIRKKILLLLNEIEVQHNLDSALGYDYMFLYQNVHNRTERAYSLLGDKQLAEYLFQCLVNMFFACDTTHPLLSGTSSADKFYISMGATSLYFDMREEDSADIHRVACELVKEMKKEGSADNNNREKKLELVETRIKETYKIQKFIDDLSLNNLKLDGFRCELEEPSPHPIIDYSKKTLKRLYYNNYLRFFPARFLRKIIENIEEETSKQLDNIYKKSIEKFKSLESLILPGITKLLSEVNEKDGALFTVEDEVKSLQEFMSNEKKGIIAGLEDNFWQKLINDDERIPENQQFFFEEYHDVYLNDIRTKNNGAGCNEMKQQTVKELNGLLSEEPTTLSVLGRAFLAGIISVLSLLPILIIISPTFIDLGNVQDNIVWWSVFTFISPLLFFVIKIFFYLKKRKRAIRILRAYYTHDAYARLANRIEFETNDFYNKAIELCERYLERCKKIRNEVTLSNIDSSVKLPLPTTMFNQPLRGGMFNKETIIPEDKIEGTEIKVNSQKKKVVELTSSHYYLLLNYFKDEISSLFKDVNIVEKQARVFNDETQKYEFKGKEYFQSLSDDSWAKNKEDFKVNILKAIEGEIYPREYPTIAEKLNQYKIASENVDLLKPMFAYASVNGEISSDSDLEYTDVKVNKNINELLEYLPLQNRKVQVDEHLPLYGVYLFITRWRSFNKLSYNRILPTEDFDMLMREQRVFDDSGVREENVNLEKNNVAIKNGDKQVKKNEEQYKFSLSSILLWSVSPIEDTSSEWLRLFDANHFVKAYDDRILFRKIMNQND